MPHDDTTEMCVCVGAGLGGKDGPKKRMYVWFASVNPLCFHVVRALTQKRIVVGYMGRPSEEGRDDLMV